MTDLKNTMAEVRSLWWIPLVQGILALLLGVFLFGQPTKTLLVLITWLGLYWLIDGGAKLVDALLSQPHAGRLWQFIYGVVGILAGFVALAQPLFSGLLTSHFVAIAFAISMIVNGLIMIFMIPAINPVTGQRTWGSLLLSILYVIGGVSLLVNPTVTALTLLTLFAFWFIVVGVSQILLAFQLKNLGKA